MHLMHVRLQVFHCATGGPSMSHGVALSQQQTSPQLHLCYGMACSWTKERKGRALSLLPCYGSATYERILYLHVNNIRNPSPAAHCQ